MASHVSAMTGDLWEENSNPKSVSTNPVVIKNVMSLEPALTLPQTFITIHINIQNKSEADHH